MKKEINYHILKDCKYVAAKIAADIAIVSRRWAGVNEVASSDRQPTSDKIGYKSAELAYQILIGDIMRYWFGYRDRAYDWGGHVRYDFYAPHITDIHRSNPLTEREIKEAKDEDPGGFSEFEKSFFYSEKLQEKRNFDDVWVSSQGPDDCHTDKVYRTYRSGDILVVRKYR